MIELTEVKDENGNGIANIDDVKIFLENNPPEELEGDGEYSAGDFRSKAVQKYRKEADIIITNPPFSLFREFVKWIDPNEKKFLIIGNMNAITYKEIFPLIKDNILWLGVVSGKKTYTKPDGTTQDMGNTCWFTNLDHGRRHEPLQLMSLEDNLKHNAKEFEKYGGKYAKYDNYDAIEVGKVKLIPSDYGGVMGVPISFLDKYNPDQFEILGATESEGKGFSNGLHDETSKVAQAEIVRNEEREREYTRGYSSDSDKQIQLRHLGLLNNPKDTRVNGKSKYARVTIKHRIAEDIRA